MVRLTTALILTVLLVPTPRLRAEAPRNNDPTSAGILFERAWQYDQGLGTPINMPEAIRLYRKAANGGNSLAQGRLAMIYFSGNGVAVNKGEAEKFAKGIFPDVLKAAENNNGVAQLIVSYMYGEGLGVARNQDEAVNWLFKASRQDLPLAWADCGVTYEHGLGIDMNQAQAIAWYRKAAEANNAMARAYLGDMYLHGKGVPRDEYAAVYWYQLGAGQGNAHAQTNLGYMYEHGCAVPCNPYEAFRLYRLAAEQNFAVAQHNLGVMYQNDCNWREAVKWHRKAAAQDYAPAIEALRCLGYDEW